jgi:hypothetical protein
VVKIAPQRACEQRASESPRADLEHENDVLGLIGKQFALLFVAWHDGCARCPSCGARSKIEFREAALFVLRDDN